ncbi:abortive infection system antitoxin AbiGi family protein [Serratia proteamaculans]|uniref:abortive infection system antitoxin AbiGi family protein n=1 Tax=Serratia proteamaculans TaxID=28151 RepID=UPI00217B6F8E|nr:abortive infection system antitoxin AbiGi family protein [Serratia proteamaculans]CAI1738977.1 Protein of uncharacterised function (DUF2743) [Serratia proteamaculans]
MAKSLHPSTLFHFTIMSENFFNILNEGRFKPFLAREHIKGMGRGGSRNFGVPMVSFCDIRLSQLDEHTIKYGEFGFDLTKEWAEKNSLHPVLYMSKNSTVFSVYNQRMRVLKNALVPLWNDRKNLKGKDKLTFNKLKSEYGDLYNLLRYMKNYRGKLIQGGELKDENFIFADEKEWRYVPEPFVGDMWPSMDLSKIESREDKLFHSSKFSSFSIDFTLNDIKYIIIPDDSYTSEVMGYLRDYDGFDENMLSKILTMQQVKADF